MNVEKDPLRVLFCDFQYRILQFKEPYPGAHDAGRQFEQRRAAARKSPFKENKRVPYLIASIMFFINFLQMTGAL